MPTPISGAEIKPRLPQINDTGVSEDKLYVSGRSYDNLRKVSALTAVAFEVARRIDGIIKNQPRDGKLRIDEMVTMEDAEFKATLFPEEKAEQPVLWKTLELPTVPAATAPTVQPLEPLASLVKLETQVPTEIDMSKSVEITKLSAPVQRLAQRIQLVLDADDHPSTIALADINTAIAEPERFTPEDRQQFALIKREIESLIRREPSPMSAKVIVPEPGVVQQTLPHQGQVKFSLSTRITIADNVATNPGSGNQFHPIAPPTGAVTRTQIFNVVVPAGCQAIMMNIHGEGEVLLEQGAREMNLSPGSHRVELWKDGQRIESSEVILPRVAPREIVSLDTMLGVPMETSSGKSLVRVDTSRPPVRTQRERMFSGEYVTEAQVASRRPAELGTWCSFNAALPPGVYDLPNRQEKLRVYTSRLISIANANQEIFLRPAQTQYVNHRTGAGAQGRDLYMAMGAPNPNPDASYLNVWVSGTNVGQVRIANRIG